MIIRIVKVKREIILFSEDYAGREVIADMRILQVNAIEGPNYFHYKPVIRGIVFIPEDKRITTNLIDGFNKRLLNAFPSLLEHSCSRGRQGGFIERINEGTMLGHVLEHVAIEMLNLAGEKVSFGKTTTLNEEAGEYEVVFSYYSREAAIEAIRMACHNINLLLAEEEICLNRDIIRLKEWIQKVKLGPTTENIINQCKLKGIPYQRLGNNALFQLGYGFRQHRIWASMTEKTSCIGADIASDKELTRKILYEAGIPVPEGTVVETEEELNLFLERILYPVVIKPCTGNQGKGVSINIKNKAEAFRAFRIAKGYCARVIIERYIKGDNFRFLIAGKKMIACARRIPPKITGDGKTGVKDLIETENSRPERKEGHIGYLSKIIIDPTMIFYLQRQGLSLNTVLEKGKEILLRENSNLSTGGIAEDVTEDVHPDNAQLAIWAAETVGLDIAGIDFNSEDIRKSYLEKGGAVLEVNASPGLRMHIKPSAGKQRNVGKEIVDILFSEGNGRIPIVTVTGTNGKTTVVRMVSKIMQDNKIRVGMTSSEGVFINGKMLIGGDMTGPLSAKMVLGHPEVQAAVLETARGGILREGLGYDYADVAVITNISEDHLGSYGIENVEEMAKVKSLVAERVHKYGYVVLNADDARVSEFKKDVSSRIIYFSSDYANPKVSRHIALGGTGVLVKDNQIKVCQGFEIYNICRLQNIPITWNGKAKHNVENILSAVGACWALGYSPRQIRGTLIEFGKENIDNPGRLEYYNINGIMIILDYAHNYAGIKEIISTIGKLRKNKSIGCIGMPGDRQNKAIKQYARAAAQGLDYIIIKEDSCLRGRRKGEVAEILKEEIIKTGFNRNNLIKVLDEEKAFMQAIEKAKEGDLVVAFFEKAEPLRKIIMEWEKKTLFEEKMS